MFSSVVLISPCFAQHPKLHKTSQRVHYVAWLLHSIVTISMIPQNLTMVTLVSEAVQIKLNLRS